MQSSIYTVQQLNEFYQGFLSLDGQTHILKDEAAKTEKATLVPYKFGGKVRWNIAKNLSILKRHNEDFTKARDGLILELSNGKGTIDETDKDAITAANTKVQELLATDVEVSGLLGLALDDLNLEANPIPGSIVALLMPLIKE